MRNVFIRLLLPLTIVAVFGVLVMPLRAQDRPGHVSPATVLVVKNELSPDSKAIADYYVRKRHIPAANVCTITCSSGEECTLQEYKDLIEGRVKGFLAQLGHPIDCIVLTKGIPIRTAEGSSGGWCVDSL